MKHFDEKRKIIVLFVGLCCIITILIIVFCKYYSSNYNFITENEDFYINSEKENSEIDEIKNEEIKQEKNFIKIHIARCCEKRGCN